MVKLNNSFDIEASKKIEVSSEYKDNKGWSWNESGEGYRNFGQGFLQINF